MLMSRDKKEELISENRAAENIAQADKIYDKDTDVDVTRL
jgi:hypothetical protein